MTILFTLNKMQKKTAFLAVFFQNGGPEGIRTLDLCVANAALSQLSYGPICSIFRTSVSASRTAKILRILRCFAGHSLSQLSYEPMFDF